MKIYRLITLSALLTTFSNLDAQRYKDFEFKSADLIEVPEYLKEKDEAIIDKTYSVEYVFPESGEMQYNFTHTITIVNSDDRISANNKIYVSSNEKSEYLFQKARVISPDGSVKLLKDSDIKEGVYDNDGNEQKYYYYALEGLQQGSIIEQATYKRMGAQYYGELIYLQGDEYRHHQLFELIAPKRLIYEFKALNGANEIELDTTTSEEINRWFFSVDSVVKILDQPYLYKNVVKQGMLYKLDRNNAMNTADITNYSRINDFINNRAHQELDKKSKKWLDNLVKELKLKGKSDKEIVIALENYLKTEFNIVSFDAEQFEQLSSVIESKVANEWGITVMMVYVLEQLGVNYQIVLTTDRTDLRFQEDFEAYMYLNEILLYFPKDDLYMAPSDKFGRGNYIPPSWRNNYGYFLKTVKVGDLTTLIGQIKFIEPLGYKANSDIMDIKVDFTKDLKQPLISFSKIQTGNVAKSLQPYVSIIDEVNLKEIKTNLTDMVHEEIESDDLELINTEENDFGTKPFEIKFTTNKHRFVETAGNDILFKVGELIGPQMELYQEDERQFPIESEYKRYYKRNIELILPDNYTLNNTEGLNFTKVYAEEGDTMMLFTSKIEQKGNSYVVESVEYYDRIIYPTEIYEQFAEVINAAADFNKVVLILKVEKN